MRKLWLDISKAEPTAVTQRPIIAYGAVAVAERVEKGWVSREGSCQGRRPWAEKRESTGRRPI